MKVRIKQELCCGAAMCKNIAPSVFDLNDGIAYVKYFEDTNVSDVGESLPSNPELGSSEESASSEPDSDGFKFVPEEHRDDVKRAVGQCIGECIFIESDEISV